MKQFQASYSAANASQKKAIDTIEGPVIVVAGPGTGKTQLLSMRVANILRNTDVNPQNILCLTFTESASATMRERLADIIGKESFGVAVHTFHSFGSEIISQYPDYFYKGADFKPADELNTYEILNSIFEKLPHDNVLSSVMNGEFTALRDAQRAISDLKKSSLMPSELIAQLDNNDKFINFAEPMLAELFSERLSKKTARQVHTVLTNLKTYQDKVGASGNSYPRLSTVAIHSLNKSLHEAELSESTKALGKWRSDWLEKDVLGKYVFKDRKRNAKLRALSSIYEDYMAQMQKKFLYDYDDMILKTVHALEKNNDLRLNLQEQYQYVLVDEFQDTNGVQMRLLWNLTNNEVSNGRPNILVVGDDDQAIYRFQGADVNNILNFKDFYRQPEIITLNDTYRCAKPILGSARSIALQISERIEGNFEKVSKNLVSHNSFADSNVSVNEYSTSSHEYSAVAQNISNTLKQGEIKPSEIAIIARNHKQLQQILPYLINLKIPIAYERRDNVLESPPILALDQLANVVVNMAQQNYVSANAALPKLLAHPAWRISPKILWQVGLKAHKEQKQWLEVMLEMPKSGLKNIAEWLLHEAQAAQHQPLEVMLDSLLGSFEYQISDDAFSEPSFVPLTGPLEEFHSPLRAYYFSEKQMQQSATTYVSYLQALTTIRRRLREYQPDTQLSLADFCKFNELHRSTGISISYDTHIQTSTDSVQLMTAHKAKGQEFDSVYIIGLNDSLWGTKSSGKRSSIQFPHNLPLAPAGDSDDEKLRLIYVAMTRAKNNLHLSWHTTTSSGRQTLPAAYLQAAEFTATLNAETSLPLTELTILKNSWAERLLDVPQADIKDLLQPVLKYYKLSSTHINNFTDVTQGGPQAFLLQNLLRFPQATSASAAYGSAIHSTLAKAHAHLRTTQQRSPIEDVLNDFEKQLRLFRLSVRDHEHYALRGSDSLNFYLKHRYDTFSENQISEQSFNGQMVTVDEVAINGIVDLMDIDENEKTIIITDYKTGKPADRWLGSSDFEKIKLHKYRQQLLFYKLLVENSSRFKGYTVTKGVLEFVEPGKNGTVSCLELKYDSGEVERFKLILKTIWNHIQKLDFPDTSDYEANIKGVLLFEDKLVNG